MTYRVLPRIRRFFEGAGRVVSTPSGDARGHYHSQRQMYDLIASDRFLGR
jgi:hypothetical protein